MDPKLVVKMDRVICAAKTFLHTAKKGHASHTVIVLEELKSALQDYDDFTGNDFNCEAALQSLLYR